GYAELLQEDAQELGVAEMNADLERIRSSGQMLLALINDVLDLSKIESGRMELYLEQIQLSALVRDLKVAIAPSVQKNGNELTVVYDTAVQTVYLDYTKLRQMLLNLLSNAAKFTHEGHIWLRITTPPTHNNHLPHLLIEVEDTGIGMSDQQMAEIFQPFRQADASTTRQYGGTGLGLAITNHFCHMMGGNIQVVSQEGVGSTFTIQLPLQEVPQAITPSKSLPSDSH
ncbi:MAG: hypothetical protein KDD89_14565, partial [Anaerolineales bacterium]|nr:hypothetical protein [Anaerolineales bacterium]